MSDPKGLLIIPIGYNPSGDVRAITVNANDYLNTVLETGLTGGGMGDPKGFLATVLGYNPDGDLRAVALDANDNVLISLLGGSANQIIKSDGTDAEWDDLTDVIEAVILTTDGDMLYRFGGVAQRLPKGTEDQVLSVVSGDPSWRDGVKALLTAAGDIVYASATNVLARLAKGSDDDVLTLASGIPSWAAPAAAGNYTLIEDIHLTAVAATIDFQNIPATYKHLELHTFLRVSGAVATGNVPLRFNNDSGNNYDYFREAYRISTDVKREGIAGTSMDNVPCNGSVAPANVFAGCKAVIPDYTDTTIQKSLSSLGHTKQANSTANIFLWNGCGWWRSSAAINRLTLISPSGNFIAGCRATLYGLD